MSGRRALTWFVGALALLAARRPALALRAGCDDEIACGLWTPHLGRVTIVTAGSDRERSGVLSEPPQHWGAP